MENAKKNQETPTDSASAPRDASSSRDAASVSDQPEFRRRGLVREFWDYLLENKAWWMVPILAMVLLLAVLLIFGSTAIAPFVYPLF